MLLYLTLRLLHIASAMMLVGGITARQLVRSKIRRLEDPRAMAVAFQAMQPIEKVMVIRAGSLVFVFGVVLALMTGAPIFGFLQGASQNWLLAANALIIWSFLMPPLIFIPRGRTFGKILEEAALEGRVTPALQAAMDDPVVRYSHIAEITALALVVVLMVFKPF